MSTKLSAAEPGGRHGALRALRAGQAGRACDRLVIPSTKQMESRMLDLPLPFRPVIALKKGSNAGTVTRVAYDLKPSSVISSIYISRAARTRARSSQRSALPVTSWRQSPAAVRVLLCLLR